MLRDFDFLSDLHLIVVVNIDLEVGWSDAPSDTADDFIKGFERGDSDSEVTSEEKDLVDLLETRIIFGIVVDDLCHMTDWIFM